MTKVDFVGYSVCHNRRMCGQSHWAVAHSDANRSHRGSLQRGLQLLGLGMPTRTVVRDDEDLLQREGDGKLLVILGTVADVVVPVSGQKSGDAHFAPRASCAACVQCIGTCMHPLHSALHAARALVVDGPIDVLA